MRKSTMRPKSPRLQLDALHYQKLCQEVLQRDGWKCQNCGSMKHLQIHHQEFRSHGGSDSEKNLITLCDSCHGGLHTPPHPDNLCDP